MGPACAARLSLPRMPTRHGQPPRSQKRAAPCADTKRPGGSSVTGAQSTKSALSLVDGEWSVTLQFARGTVPISKSAHGRGLKAQGEEIRRQAAENWPIGHPCILCELCSCFAKMHWGRSNALPERGLRGYSADAV